MRLLQLFITIICVGLAGIMHFDFKEMRKEKSKLLYQIDSLKNENFINQTNYTRYVIASEKLMECDSVCANKFDEMLSNIE